MELAEAFIRKGKFRKAQLRLRALARKKQKDRAWSLRLAYLCRAAGIADVGLAILRPKVRGPSARPTDEERAEYGIGLAQVGAGREALEVLAPVDVAQVPWAFQGVVLAHLRQWDWEGAIPLIERFLAQRDHSRANLLWARYYLGRSLQHGPGELGRANGLLSELATTAEREEYWDLRRETLVALVDNFLLSRDWSGARSIVAKLKKDENAKSVLRVLQCEAELGLFRAPRSKAAGERMQAVTQAYREARAWERVRDCDYYAALARRDESLFARVYFGTPYASARRCMLRQFGVTEATLPKSIEWPSVTKGATLDLVTGQVADGRRAIAAFKPGQLALRVLRALCSDFYVPRSIPALFEAIYPDEYYHPTAGPDRVRQALAWTRRELARSRLDLRVLEDRGAYVLDAGAGLSLRVPRPGRDLALPDKEVGRLEGLLERVRSRVGKGEAFDSARFAELAGLSERSAQRYLRLAIERSLLASSGAGPSRRYSFAKSA